MSESNHSPVVANTAVMTDDPLFATEIASCFPLEREYFPVISLPRMTRDDWEFEVMRREAAIARSAITEIVCKETDFGLLAPLRKSCKAEFLPCEKASDLSKWGIGNKPSGLIKVAPLDYREGLQVARLVGKRVVISERSDSLMSSKNVVVSKTLLLVERTNTISDLAALLFAFVSQWNISFFGQPRGYVARWQDEERFKKIFRKLSAPNSSSSVVLEELNREVESVINLKSLSGQYDSIQLVVESIPYGIVIEGTEVAHLFSLETDLKFLEFLSNKAEIGRRPRAAIPSYFFIDTQSNDLTSEIPQVKDTIGKSGGWTLNLNGKQATRESFRLLSQYYPFDAMLVSGHGSSPDCRIVEFEFLSRDGVSHTGVFLEYYQFGPKVGELIQVETKIYPKSFDGIPWADKEALEKTGKSHLFKDFMDAKLSHKQKLLNEKKVDAHSIEGLRLSDGVFLGNIRFFDRHRNPLIFLNTCGSLLEIGAHLSLAGAGACIGTMWSVADTHAAKMAADFFDLAQERSLSEALQWPELL